MEGDEALQRMGEDVERIGEDVKEIKSTRLGSGNSGRAGLLRFWDPCSWAELETPALG